MGRSISLPKFQAAIVGNLDKFKEIADYNTKKKVGSAIGKHAQAVLVKAQELVPEKTGLLKSTLRVKQSGDGLHATVRTDHGKAPHDYLVHFGTVKMEGRPFLYQANEQLAGQLAETVKAELDA